MIWQERFRMGRWVPWMAVGLLSVSVVANLILLAHATSDPAFAVEPDYYAKAVDWDRIQAAQAASLRLGWKADLQFERSSAGSRADRATLKLSDARGLPVVGAVVRVSAFAKARAQRFAKGVFEEIGDGLYVWRHDFARPGRWEFRLEASREVASGQGHPGTTDSGQVGLVTAGPGPAGRGESASGTAGRRATVSGGAAFGTAERFIITLVRDAP